MGKSDSKEKIVIIDDDDDDDDDDDEDDNTGSEDWCFLCKEGGDLLICDYEGCRKVYHRVCLKKHRIRIPKHDKKWFCSRHVCSECSKPAVNDCFCCPKAVCNSKKCIKTADLTIIKNNRGLCEDCLTLAQHIERNDEFSLEGVLDFDDRNSFECLFKEYLELKMKEESFTFEDINAANDCLNKAALDSVEIVKGDDNTDIFVIDHDDDDDSNEENRNSEPETSDKKMETERDVIELDEPDDDDDEIELDDSNNDDDGIKMDESNDDDDDDDVAITLDDDDDDDGDDDDDTDDDEEEDDEFKVDYKKAAPKRQRVSSKDKSSRDRKTHARRSHTSVKDEQNELIFGIKPKYFVPLPKTETTLNRTKKESSVCNVKEKSFAHEDDLENEIEARNDMKIEIVPDSKMDNDLDSNRNSPDKVENEDSQDRCFASIIVDNIKLVYLRKGLLLKFIKEANYLEEKVVGCFVRMKKAANKISHQLLQVTGITMKPLNEMNSEVLLQLSCSSEFKIDLMSDDDITEDECKELREKIEEGLIARPTVSELEEKAASLHEDITKHWIERELERLQKRIGLLNERGRRREMELLINKLALLKKESEQQRLLQRLPKVTPAFKDD